ncbi:hypothetical protein NIES4071_87450 [Calothrix sp. NIES-4071]|nr:hypothetical protein NIES4071_87450 [Calothrix sp. NIES-4071]BAZ63012.1 hypothetical protein NIES4105_87380 [Calothrix sp. NIES-4105]
MDAYNLNQYFPLSEQHKYFSQLQGRVGLTRRRAEYFVRLWAYLFLKQQHELGRHIKAPLTELELPSGFVPCTHREAQDVFYGDSDRGSDRAAGMMIDKFVGLGLIEKKFDGNSICIRIKSLLAQNSLIDANTIELYPDAFNPRVDAIPVATFLARYYHWIDNKNVLVPQRIARILREWAQLYPTSMRVLRRRDTQNAVGCYIFYPVAKESEDSFFMSPRKTLYLGSHMDVDPIKMAAPQDLECNTIQVRAWQIDFPYKNKANIEMFLLDSQETLIKMQADYPNLCDIYTIPLHPADEQLVYTLGFQNISQDQQPLQWIYMALDTFLKLNIPQVLSNLNFN